MVTLVLPFPTEDITDNSGKGSPESDQTKALPETLGKVCEANPYLRHYLRLVARSQVGIPEYCARPTKQMADAKAPNFIYPIKGNVFAHILVDPKDALNYYIPVEPVLTMDLAALAQTVEQRCIECGDRLPEHNVDGDRKKQLLNYIDMVTTTGAESGPASWRERLPFLGRRKKGLPKVGMTPPELEGIKYLFVRDKIGLGVLEPLMSDPYIEDISCAGVGQVFIEHKVFKSLKSIITFNTLEELDEFVLRLAEQIKKAVSYRNPVADATLPNGARINIVYGRDVSKRGSNFTVRQFSEVPLSIFDLVDFGTINYQILAYLSLVIANGMNLFVSGESASGKTSMLNALTTFIHPNAKIITIEDTPELQVPHENWIREVVQATRADDTSGAVTTFDLLKAALRQRPNEILVGEIRGPEGNVAFQAMQTGHSVMATFHAATVEKLIQRITSSPISVPRTYIDNLNVAILMSSVKLPTGRVGRRVTGISEIVGYDSLSQSYNVVESFAWDESTDKFLFTGHMSSHVLENKIGPKMGMAGAKKHKIYAEVDRRARILEKLHCEEKVTGFYETLEVLKKAQRQGLF